MKKFLKFFLVTLFFVELFMILGGGLLIYEGKYYLYGGILFALLISLLLMVLDSMSEKIEKLEKRVEFLENRNGCENLNSESADKEENSTNK